MKQTKKKTKKTTGYTETSQIPLGTVAKLTKSPFSSQCVEEPIPEGWKKKAKLGWKYYTEEAIVSNVIDSWKSFAIGDEIKLTSDNEDSEKKAREFFDKHDIHKIISDSLIQLMTKGDSYNYKKYTDKGDNISEIVVLNPITIKRKIVNGVLTEIKQYPDEESVETGTGDGTVLSLDQLLSLKYRAPQWSPHGYSMVLPAFQPIALLGDYRKAQQAVAKRWTTPLRLIKVGGPIGKDENGADRYWIPTQTDLDNYQKMFENVDLKNGVIVTSLVNLEQAGSDGEVLKINDDIEEVKEDIMVALGMSKSIVTSNGPNFATANVGFKKILITISEIKKFAKKILNWIFDDWKNLNGFENENLNFILPEFKFDDLDLKKILLELYDRGLISKDTIQAKNDLDPAAEKAQQEENAKDPLYVNDPKLVVDMVNSGIMSVATAQKKLGLSPENELGNENSEVMADVEEIYMKATSSLFDLETSMSAMADNGAFEEAEILETINKGNYEIKTILVDMSQYGGEKAKPMKMVVCYSTFDGSFIGSPDTGIMKFIKKNEISQIQTIDKDDNVASIGWCEKEKKWYGWSHRAIYGFTKGSEVKEGDCAYMSPDKEDFIEDCNRFWSHSDHENTKSFEVEEDGKLGVKTEWTYSKTVPNEKIRGNVDGVFTPYPETFGKGCWKAKNINDAKQMAIDFAHSVANLSEEEQLKVTGDVS